jgi:hypothetical protein
MATYGNNIVSKGLMIHVDAGNKRSYPGSGSNWYNLANDVFYTANSSYGALNAGVSWDAGPPASMVFTSASSGIVGPFGRGADFFSPTVSTWNNLHEFTLEAWAKSSGMGASQTLGGIWAFTYGGRLHFQSGGSVTFGYDTGTTITGISSSGTNYLDGVWHHIVGTQRNAGGELYVDGVLKATNSHRWQGKTRWSTDSIYIGRDNNNSIYYLNGNIAIARMYRRWLSPADVLKNFNAERGRFGV